ncbi:NAD-dependent succinate-semialdehyde dehydrogenase [Croceicoccus naphthovorans]|uniref:Succinate dehydrogenase n=1 Tax=Croceicoccus naphthovorans TaxID=1348774 RepID=A0A0G3XBC5_9SPHN|nr:NAD-dependent succinate-semialdehyde dehydrogenase [Croceicoccus naphthovorans]AKM08845.1 succinate dehydrogenase [Croceicoccus naphthovorans]
MTGASENQPAYLGSLSVNPATGETIALHPWLDERQVGEAVDAASAAFEQWRHIQHRERAAALRKLADALEARAEALAQLISLEMGKPILRSRGEVAKCAALCRWYADHAERLLADEPVDMGGDGKAVVRYRPLGIVLAVMPWNFPLWQVLRAAVPVIAGGNAMLLKHADNVQGCANALADCFRAADFPAGLFANIHVPRTQIASLLADPRVVGVSVTAGTAAGGAIAAEAGRNLKKSVLELGGSDPFIVLADADLDRAVPAAIEARFQNSGQVCIAAKRLIVEAPIAEAFTARFVAAAEALVCGDPLDDATDLGPLARARARDELHSQVERSLAMGARLLAGGQTPDGPGAFYPPTVLAEVTPAMPVFREETFGPVAAIIVADDSDHAVRLANDSDFGLSGAIWSGDRARATTLARRIETGAVHVNGVPVSDPRVPIGGVRQSGYGRELSHFGIREFCNAQLVWEHG